MLSFHNIFFILQGVDMHHFCLILTYKFLLKYAFNSHVIVNYDV